MSAGTLRMELYDRDVALSVVDGALKYSAPEGALTPALLADVKLHKVGLMAILEAEGELVRLRAEEERLEAELVAMYTAAGGVPDPRDEYDSRLVEVDGLLARIETLESQAGGTEAVI